MNTFIPFKLPEFLKLGVSTAPTQIEGKDTNNSWYHWALDKNHIKDQTLPIPANEHWERYPEDLALMAKMGITVYRMGIEWSAIEPEEGKFSQAAMDHYISEIKLMHKLGIKPLVTLHHFSNPGWFEKQKAFETEESIAKFCNYVRYICHHLKDLVSEYITINEPNVYAFQGYLFGTWPPGKKSFKTCLEVLKNLALCHLHAYKIIHEIYDLDQDKAASFPSTKEKPQNVKVGFANHFRVFSPINKNPIHWLGSKTAEYLFQDVLTKAMCTGKFSFPLGFSSPLGQGTFYDFIGINYYSRSWIKYLSQVPQPPSRSSHELSPCPIQNHLGWDIHPKGLLEISQKIYKKYPAALWITENGTCDRKDHFRSAFIYQHLWEIAHSTLPFERYYHWTFLDNFEWSEGENAPFGLVECNFQSQERTIKNSGLFYSEVIHQHQISTDMITEYLIEKKEADL